MTRRNREKLVERGDVVQCDTSTGKDGKEYPRQVERKAPEPERLIAQTKPITILETRCLRTYLTFHFMKIQDYPSYQEFFNTFL